MDGISTRVPGTPIGGERPVTRQRLYSPIHPMADLTHPSATSLVMQASPTMVPTSGQSNDNPTNSQMLHFIRQENALLRQSMEGLSQGVRSDLQVVLNRLGGIERRLDLAEIAITKLEDIMDSPSAIGSELHKQVEALEAKVRSLQISQVSQQSTSHNTSPAGGNDRTITAVLGGLDAFKGDQ